MEFSTCPICNLSFPSFELQRHANSHFSDEDYAADFELAQQIALIPPTPPRIVSIVVEDSLKCSPSSLDIPESSSSRCDAEIIARGINNNEEKFYKVECNLMTMLRKCLELEPENSVSILCGHIDHFQSIESWDIHWGCGWRNIQMLSSYLLSQREEAKDALYGGCGFVPNIRSLQRWLELAWDKGFDTPGSDDFDRKIHGKINWIGTTECAALFRSFGLRARIVDFCSKDLELAHLGRKNKQVYGPMDIFLSKRKIDLSESSKHSTNVSFEEVKGHQVLCEWVWNYFSGNNAGKSGNCRVVLSEKLPLYFQQDGHSRTIVGIQAKHLRNGTKQYNLLIFDPSTSHGHDVYENDWIVCWVSPVGPAHGPIMIKHAMSMALYVAIGAWLYRNFGILTFQMVYFLENKSSRKNSERECGMAKINKERCPHTEKAAVPVVLY